MLKYLRTQIRIFDYTEDEPYTPDYPINIMKCLE